MDFTKDNATCGSLLQSVLGRIGCGYNKDPHIFLSDSNYDWLQRYIKNDYYPPVGKPMLGVARAHKPLRFISLKRGEFNCPEFFDLANDIFRRQRPPGLFKSEKRRWAQMRLGQSWDFDLWGCLIEPFLHDILLFAETKTVQVFHPGETADQPRQYAMHKDRILGTRRYDHKTMKEGGQHDRDHQVKIMVRFKKKGRNGIVVTAIELPTFISSDQPAVSIMKDCVIKKVLRGDAL